MPTIFRDKVTLVHSIDNCAFNDATTLADWPGAVRVSIDDMPGWADSTDLDVIKSPRGVGDGDYIANRFPFKSKMLMLQGYIVAPDRATLDTLWDLVQIQAFPANVDITLTRFEPVPKYVVCRLAGPVEQLQYFPDEGTLRFQATLLCADPFKYDAVNTISGSAGVSGVSSGGRSYPRTYPLTYAITAAGSGNSITVYNAGTVDTAPLIGIHGPLPVGWRVENSTTGDTQAFAVDLSVTDTLVIDNAAKTATLNGVTVNGLLVGSWMVLKPRTNVLRLFGDYDPSAGFTVSAKSAWR